MTAPVARDIIEAIRGRRVGWNPFVEMNVRFYGAVPGVDATATITKIGQDGYFNIIFPAGAWVITSTPTIPAGVNITALPGATFTGAGAGVLGLANAGAGGSIVSNQISDYNPPVTGELATLNVFRNPSYAGGPAGVNAAIRAQTNVGANVTNSEWAIIGIVNNQATSGSNVGIYGQGNKFASAGQTWGMVAEGRDKSGNADPTTGLVGLEVDCFADGTDVHGLRVGIDVVGGQGVSVAPNITYGIRIGPVSGNVANCNFTHGLFIYGVNTYGIRISSAAGSTVGIDVSGATLSGAALRLANLQFISFTAGDNRTLSYIGTNGGLTYSVGGTAESVLTDTGGIKLNMNGVPLILDGTSSTGAATPTLSANKPGANAGVFGWLSGNIGGTKIWIPAFSD